MESTFIQFIYVSSIDYDVTDNDDDDDNGDTDHHHQFHSHHDDFIRQFLC